MAEYTQGMIIPTDGSGQPVIFPVNPDEIKGPTTKVNYAVIDVEGKEHQLQQYVNGDVSTISFDIEVARISSGNEVTGLWKALVSLTKPTVKRQGMGRPPRVKFTFGSFLSETCVVAAITPAFKRIWSKGLNPYYGVISVTLNKWAE